MLGVAGGEAEPTLQRRCRDERVGHAQAMLASDAACSLGDGSIDWDLPQRRENPNGQVRACGGGEELGPGDHRVMKTMASDPQFDGPT